jgi:hypothetical protein
MLPPRLAFEREDALREVSDRAGYSPEAVRRAFQARFFRERRSERERVAVSRGEQLVERVVER